MRVLVAFLLAAGCATSQGGDAGSPAAGGKADGDLPTITFAADWSVTQSAPIVKGGQVVIRYAPERLPDCRARTDTGEDTWQIVGHYTLDGNEPYHDDIAVTELEGNGRSEAPSVRPVDAVIDVPLGTFGGGHDWALWFVNSDDTGCSAYDSDFGQNFHFTIED